MQDQLNRWRPATAGVRYRSLQQFFKWVVEEEELTESPMARMSPPHVPEDPVPVVADDDLRRLLKACGGKAFEDRRDSAVMWLFIDTGCRLGEVAGLDVADVDLDLNVITVIGKGDRTRTVPFGAKAGQAIDRYLRARLRHPNSGSGALWLGAKGRMTDSGLCTSPTATLPEGRATSTPSPPTPSHRCPQLVGIGWQRRGCDAVVRMAVPADAQPLRGERGR